MRQWGVISSWKLEKGFGFISPDNGSLEIFVHINEFHNRRRQPLIGDHVSFTVALDAQRRVQARKVLFQGETQLAFIPVRQVVAFMAIVVYIALILITMRRYHLPSYILPGVLAWNFVVYLLYRHDKRAAEVGGQRLPENILHLCAVMGGWPASWIAQFRLRHKSSKTSFLIVFYLTVLLNLSVLAYSAISHQSGF